MKMRERLITFAVTPAIWGIFFVVWVILTLIIVFYAIAYPFWALAGRIELKDEPKTRTIGVNIT